MSHDETPIAEGEARRLLEVAAATVEVAPNAPLTLTGLPDPLGADRDPDRPRWLAVVAAAAAVAVLVGGGVLAGLLVDGDRGSPAQRPTPATSPPTSSTAVPADGLPLKLERAAAAFESWADGSFGFPPTFAAEVRLLLQDAPWDTLSFAEAQDPQRWSMCSGVAPQDCRADPVRAVGAGAVQRFRQPGSVCRALAARLPADLEAARAGDLVRLTPVGDRGCDTVWHVELWVDDDGEIYAVNYLSGSG